MSGVDVSRYRFDYGLTMAFLLMNADGTVYHRYGARTWDDPLSHMSMGSLVRVMRETLPEHEAYEESPSPPELAAPETVEDLHREALGADGKTPSCFHCHKVNDYRRKLAQDAGTWTPDEVWKYPLPDRLGLRLDPEDARRVVGVDEGSAAAKAGLRAGDRLLDLHGKRILTTADVQWILDPIEAGPLPLRYERDGEEHAATLELEKGWRVGTPLEVAWRPIRIFLGQASGFVWRPILDTERAELGIPDGEMAGRVSHLWQRGPWKRFGDAAASAGLRPGDVVLAFDGERDFRHFRHFDMWYRLNKQPGSKLRVEVLRDGERVEITIPVVE